MCAVPPIKEGKKIWWCRMEPPKGAGPKDSECGTVSALIEHLNAA